MTIQRMEHVGIVVDDLAAATAFFVELGLELQGKGQVEGGWVDRIVGLEGVRSEFAMMETPDCHGRLELIKFHAPSGRGGDRHAPANTPGLRHLAFRVDDIEAVVARLRAHGAELVGEVERYEDSFGSATSAARRGSSSSWRSRSAEGSGRPPTASPASVVVPGQDPPTEYSPAPVEWTPASAGPPGAGPRPRTTPVSILDRSSLSRCAMCGSGGGVIRTECSSSIARRGGRVRGETCG